MPQTRSGTHVWEVDLYISGNIATSNIRPFRQLKGTTNPVPFFSDVSIVRHPNGVKMTVTASASSHDLAEKAALVFVGHMLDVLAFMLNEPLFHDLKNTRDFGERSRRIVNGDEWRQAFQEAHMLGDNFPAYLRALGWYRKGLYVDDPFDKFLAYWNAIEIVSGAYYPKPDGKRLEKTKEQIQAIFAETWSLLDRWPIEGNSDSWISDMYKIRNSIAHGAKSIDVHEVAVVDAQVPSVRNTAYTFLRDWKERLHQTGNAAIQPNVYSEEGLA